MSVYQKSLSDIKSYSEFIKSNPVVLIHFWAEWNGNDYVMKRIINQIETKFKDKVSFGSVNVDNEQMWETCQTIGLKNVPTLAYYKKGELVKTKIGQESQELIEKRLNRLLID